MPTLVITPPHLVWQWVGEIHNIFTEFNVLVYFGDEREVPSLSVCVAGKLIKDDPIFDKSCGCSNTIMLTFHETLQSCHDPGCQKDSANLGLPTELLPSWAGNNFTL